MASQVRTIDFLPEIFRTKPNEQFLNATLDQLVQPPKFTKLQGYIGSKFGYGVNSSDKYIKEPSKVRNDYQLEPAVVFKKKDTEVAVDLITYPGIIDTLKLNSGSEINHNSLFSNEFYSWDSFVDLDKLINYSQYYWLPQGPESVPITTGTLYNQLDISILSHTNTYGFDANLVTVTGENPTLTFVRGGTYKLTASQASKFWIQTSPGLTGVDPTKTNISTREIQGLDTNGITTGSMVFTVPTLSDIASNNYQGDITVDLVTRLSFNEVSGKVLSSIDGVKLLNGKTLMFYGTAADTIVTLYNGDHASVNSEIFSIYVDNNNRVILSPIATIPNNTKITAISGAEFITRSFVRNNIGDIKLLPIDTASLNTLYYQDGSNGSKFGKINIVDSVTTPQLNIHDILGKKTYASPNGIAFTNGLKVQFYGNVYPSSYKNIQYYVDGVGDSIVLMPVDQFIVPEPFGQGISAPFDSAAYDSDSFSDSLLLPNDPDYITINRNSNDRNAWSRSNRWFHVDVLHTTVKNNIVSPITSAALLNPDARGKRPIIEFYPNLKLYNMGSAAKDPITYINFTETDALTNIPGQTMYHPDGTSSVLYDGARIIFAGDLNPDVRNKIYVVGYEQVTTGAARTITLSKAYDGDVAYNEQAIVTKGETAAGHTYYFDGSMWIKAQFKQYVNQTPVFDVFDENGISLSDTNYYSGSDFTGSTLFQYSTGTGANDPVLNFPISYSAINNLGDIKFDVTLNSQSFNFVYNNVSTTYPVNAGYVHQYKDNINYTRMLGWQTAVEKSFQYQVFDNKFTLGMPSPTFVCDVPVKDDASTQWPTMVVYVNNERVSSSAYTVTVGSSTTTITLTNTPAYETPVQILLYSDVMSKTAYYQIPANFDHNPFNEQISSINLGDVRGHYKSICNNVPNLEGNAFGPNNYRDLGNLVPYGNRIIQSSAPLAVAACFLRKQNTNFLSSVSYNANEYAKFKAVLMDTVNTNDYSPLQYTADILDDALDIITSIRDKSSPFFWSDMLPAKNALITNSYTFKSGLGTSTFPLSTVYDFGNANYYSVLVYLTRKINGITRNILLVKDVDYTVSSTDKNLTVTTDLIPNDVITIKEYNQTYGTFVPNTPTKMGLYPKFMPEVFYDESYVNPAYFIRGHDGSYTKLYGDYVDGFLVDFRDRVLFEFEMRIYNNMKVVAKIPVEYDDIMPGQFRQTEFTLEQVQTIYKTQFLNWVGLNRVDHTTQYYDANNEFTWNYSESTNKLDGSKFAQGGWRGIYMWMYDTACPDTRPWEMLGLSTKPTWWESHYGAAPYTSDNLLLWTDISNGYVWNDNNPYVNEKRTRPGLLDVLPVDSNGKLVSPFVSSVSAYNVKTFNKSWTPTDVSPAEYAYLKSSAWPFDLMCLTALLKPASFFALGLDLDVYKYSAEFNQYLVYNRLRTTPSDTIFYGANETSAAHSYVNWIVDYINQFGIDGSSTVLDLINSGDVRLSYRLAGFSDKNQLTFYVEKGSPNSSNTSMMIPDDSYNVLIYDNPPDDNIVYSSIIVQRTTNGYSVYGNSQTKAYLTVALPHYDGVYDTITVGKTTATVAKNYYDTTAIVPYGTEFTSINTLAEFLKGYGAHLINQGMKFEDIENAIELNWNQMIAEMMYWSQTGWEVGSIININPCANTISIDKENQVVQPLTIHQNNFLLNQNLVPIQIKDLSVHRSGTMFSAKTLNSGDSINFFTANTSTVEHVVVFDNTTIFNDVIFNLVTGLRQQRLVLKGTMTAEWNGTMTAAGFIINQDNVEEWKANVKYNKGQIVLYKREYWIANEVTVPPSETFDYTAWRVTAYDQIQKGLLPNPSTRASESTFYYDTHSSNLSNDGDLLGFSLIGYRPRSYLSDANLDDISQVNIYQSMIANKGTVQAATNLQGITLNQTDLDYSIHENWSIKTGEFGGVLNQNFVQMLLSESSLTGNPSIVSLITSIPVEGAEQNIPLYKLTNFSRSISDPAILPTIPNTSDSKLPYAGYVNLDDIRQYAYNISRLDDANISDIYRNDYIWVADEQTKWNVYTPVSIDATLTTVLNNLDGTVIMTFDKPHGLVDNDPFGIINFDYRVNGYYKVTSAKSLRSLMVSLDLDISTTNITGIGMAFKLQSQRVTSGKEIASLPLLSADFLKNKVWVDEGENGEWNVYQKSNSYVNSQFENFTFNNGNLGAQVAYIPKLGYYATDPMNGKMYRYVYTNEGFIQADMINNPGNGYANSYGTKVAYNENYMVVSEPVLSTNTSLTSKLHVYRIINADAIETLVEENILNLSVGGGSQSTIVGNESIAITGDGEFIFANHTDVTLIDSTPIQYRSIVVFKKNSDYTYRGIQDSGIGLITNANIITGATTFTIQGSLGSVGSYLNNLFPVGAKIAFENSSNFYRSVVTIVSKVYTPGVPHGYTTFTVDKPITNARKDRINGASHDADADGSTVTPIPSGTTFYTVKTLSETTSPGDKFFKIAGDASHLIPAGKRVSFTNSGYDITYTVVTGDYVGSPVTLLVGNGIAKLFNLLPITTPNFTRSATNTVVKIDSIVQATSTYTLSGNTITFVTAPAVATTIEIKSTVETTTFHTVEHIDYSVIAGVAVFFAITDYFITDFVDSRELQQIDFPLADISNDAYGYSITTNYDGSKLFVGAPKSNFGPYANDVGYAFVYDRLIGTWEQVADSVPYSFKILVLPWSSSYNSNGYSNSVAYTIYINSVKLPPSKYTILSNLIIIGQPLKAGDIITVSTGQFVLTQQLSSYNTYSDIQAGEQFAYSMSCNSTGSELIVGAPFKVLNESINPTEFNSLSTHAVKQEGAVYRFTNEARRFGFMTGIIGCNLIEPIDILINGYMVELAGSTTLAADIDATQTTLTLSVNDYVLNLPSNGTINITTVIDNVGYVEIMEYTMIDRENGILSGLLRNSPYYDPITNPLNAIPHTASGSTVKLPLGPAFQVANAINNTRVPNVFAYNTQDERLVIRLTDYNLGQLNNKLNVTVFNGNFMYQMGFEEYTKTQVIVDPHEEIVTQFGSVVKFNEANSFVIGAPVSNRYLGTFFDFSDDGNTHNDTVFDNNLTVWEDVLTDGGAVYMYDYIPAYQESLLNLGQYAYAQTVNDIDVDYGSYPRYGSAIAFNNYSVIVGAPNFKADTVGGKITVYQNTTGKPDWSVYRSSMPVVDINSIQKVQLFDNTTDLTLTSMDYFDPLQGKLLGAVRENIDFIGSSDPAGYNSSSAAKGNITWGKSHVGSIWFDLTTVRFMDYHQADLAYNSKHWGKPFPGSTVTVYSWIESDQLPIYYNGNGTPYDLERYTRMYHVDSNNNLVSRYYYWVRNTNTLFTSKGKTLTDTVIESYINDPQNSGITYFTPLRPDTFGLYNARGYISDDSTKLHLGFSTGTNQAANHASFNLIRENYPTDFLPGVPDKLRGYTSPYGLYDRFLDSFSGLDEFGAAVPDPFLPKQLQIGINVRPRQGLFVNQYNALKNYLQYANSIIAQYPINEYSNITFLSDIGEFYDTTKYWSNIYWWATGYSNNTKPSIEVPIFAELLKLSPPEGYVAAVSQNAQGRREVYAYLSSTWTRVGLQNGTIEFSSILWDYQTNRIGFGDNFFDSELFDASPAIEIRNIIRSLNEQIFIGPLLEHRNTSLILMFEYIQSENTALGNYLPWLNKTSFADVSYTARKLVQQQKYQRDNDNILSGYINEIKPYRVVIKDFYLKYTVDELFDGYISDFDLPAQYNYETNLFESPNLVYTSASQTNDYLPSDTTWNNAEYTSWFNNYGLTLEDTPNFEITVLSAHLSTISLTLHVENARGLPVQGILRIGDEIIGYTGVNRETGVVTGLSRGEANSIVTDHTTGTAVYVDLPSIVILDSGRGYIGPPTVTSYIDTTIYPAPKRAAVLSAIMAGDKVIGVSVIDPGEGYVITPEIRFSSSIDTTFSDTNINFIDNTILIPTVTFLSGDLITTGDLVKSTVSSNVPAGSIPDGYYYLHVIAEVDTYSIVSLHDNYAQSLTGEHRVQFYKTPITTPHEHTFSTTPRAIAITRSTRTRGLTNILRFDRTSYNSKIVPWTPGEFWSSPFNSIGNDASYDAKLYLSDPYVSTGDITDTVYGIGASFNISYALLGREPYTVTINTAGQLYAVNEHFAVSGVHLSGTSPANDCYITVTAVDGFGKITAISSTGTPIDPQLASLAGAVVPILDTGYDADNNVIVSVNYAPSQLTPGNIKGVSMYFYRIFAPYQYDDTATNGAKIEVHKPRFNPFTITNQYMIRVNPDYLGTKYLDGDRIVIPGVNLGGTTGTNDAVITILRTTVAGGILSATVSGTPVNSEVRTYYINPVTDNEVMVYNDSALLDPVLYSEFYYDGSFNGHSDFMYIPEPISVGLSYKYTSTSVVSYNGDLWSCVEGNNDTTFDSSKWTKLESGARSLNALDRIIGYYQPTVNMPAKDLQQLVKGITYPHNTYYGNMFAPGDELPLDFEVRDQPFYPRNVVIKSMIFDGTSYIAVGESDVHSVVLLSDDGTTWRSVSLADKKLDVTGITSQGDMFVVTTRSSLTPIFVSYDKENWFTVGAVATTYDKVTFDDARYDTSPISCPAEQLNSVTSLNDMFYAAGESILESNDGITWTPSYKFNTKLVNNFYNITHVTSTHFTGYLGVGGGNEIASGAGTSAPTFQAVSRIATKIEDASWVTQSTAITNATLRGIGYSASSIVVVGDNGEIWYSQNTSNWSPAESTVSETLRSATYGNGIFVVVGDAGTILTSNDNGMSWTDQSGITTVDLYTVIFDGTHFYASGVDATILRSSNGLNWADVSFVTTADAFSVIKGSDFLYGYGPEELVAGVVSDTLQMRVITAPGSYWDSESLVERSLIGNTGFNMVSKIVKPTYELTINFDGMVVNPAQLSVFVIDTVTKIGTRIYEDMSTLNNPISYSIDWINKVVTLNENIQDSQSILIEVYEVGNGHQLARSNSDIIPLRTSLDTSMTEIVFDIKYNPFVDNSPVLSINDIIVAVGSVTVLLTINPEYVDGDLVRIDGIVDGDKLNDTFYVKVGTPYEDGGMTYYPYDLYTDAAVTNPVVGADVNAYTEGGVIWKDTNISVVFVNGHRLVYNTDYTITYGYGDANSTRILFNQLYEQGVDYISFAILESSYTDLNPIEYKYSIPVTEVFTGGISNVIKLTGDFGRANPENSIVELNGYRLISGSDYTIDNLLVTLTLGQTFSTDDLIAVTGYTETERLFLVTDQATAKKVISIHYVDTTTLPVQVITTDDAGFVDGDLVRIDGFSNSNINTTFYVKASSYIDGAVTYYSYAIYVDSALLNPVTGPTLGQVIGNGYIWKDSTTFQVSTPTVPNGLITAPFTYTDGSKTWVTINGMRLAPEQVKFGTSNKLHILTPITETDHIEVTSTISGSTPNQMSYTIDIDKNNQASVYKANLSDTTWLTQELKLGDNIMYVYNASNLTDSMSDTTGIISINGEKIQFTAIDRVANTVSGLIRGALGTSPSKVHAQYTMVYGITPARKLADTYYNKVWNTSTFGQFADPIQLSNTVPVNFLKG
jgi:hypothetical protein